MNQSRLEGILSERDIVRVIGERGAGALEEPVAQVMTRKVVTCKETDTVAELIALARAKPGALNYGSAGVASLAHLATALFASMAGVSLSHVPYKSSSQSMTDVITGRLDMQFATIAPSLPNIRAGQLRALATTGKTRASVLPEVPTVAESGIAGYEAALWVAFVMPANWCRLETSRR